MDIYCESQDIPAISIANKQSVELAARNARYEFYLRASMYFSANKLALAHHLDDQCETVLFNIIRGSSIHGLRGIPKTRMLNNSSNVKIIRPLLCCKKTELENFLRERHINWQIDHTNYKLTANRNILRHQILPLFEKINPTAKEHIIELSQQFSSIEEIIERQANNIFNLCDFDENQISIEHWRIKTLPEIIACEIVRKMLIAINVGLQRYSAKHLKMIVNLQDKVDLPEKIQACIVDDKLVIRKKDYISQKQCPYQLKIEQIPFEREKFKLFCQGKGRFEEMIDADKVSGEIEIRFVKEGERFRPLGLHGSKKISDFLTDVKANDSERPGTVVTDEKSIIWLVGWRIDDRVKITDKTKNVLLLKAIRAR